jgi:hypothetical protein
MGESLHVSAACVMFATSQDKRVPIPFRKLPFDPSVATLVNM